jgi:hypothetical protein
MLDDEAEERRARWTFNLVVFFLLFPFAIDLSYMTGTLIPVGVGISLIAWRVWRTPEITNRISSHMGSRLRRIVQNLAIALGPLGLILFGVSVFATAIQYTAERGFPFAITNPDSGCFGPGFAIGCVAYDPILIVLNYLFWVGLSFVVLTLADWVRTRRTSRHVSRSNLQDSHRRRELVNSGSKG